MGIGNILPWRKKCVILTTQKLLICHKNCSFFQMADRNQLKIIFYMLKNALRQILTYLETRILKIGPPVQNICQELKNYLGSRISCKICNFQTSRPIFKIAF